MIIGLAGSVVLGLRDFTDAGKMAELEKSVENASGESKEMAQGVLNGTRKLLGVDNLSSGHFRNGGIVSFLVGVTLLLLMVLLLMKKSSLYIRVFIGLLVVSMASVILNPAFSAGPNGPLSSRILALIVALIGTVGGLFGLANALLRRKLGRSKGLE